MSDALDRLRRKQQERPTVPSRDTKIESSSDKQISTSPDTLTSRNLDIENSENIELKTSGSKDVSMSVNLGVQKSRSQDTDDSLSADTQNPVSLETKQTTFRMESAVIERIQELCQKHKLSREVFLEAMFEKCEGDEELMQAILAQAQSRNEYRKQLANQKRAKSMMKKFGGAVG